MNVKDGSPKNEYKWEKTLGYKNNCMQKEPE